MAIANSPPPFSRRRFIQAATALAGGALVGHQDPRASATPASARQSSPALPSILTGAYDPGADALRRDGFSVTFADLERQTAALGLELPSRDAGDDDKKRWIGRLAGLAVPDAVREPDLARRLPELAGFDVTDLRRTAEINPGLDGVTSYAGRFDRAHLTATWAELGYEEIKRGDVTIFSLAEDDTFDSANPVQRVFLARHNNVALIEDRLLIFTSRLDRLREAVAAATGEIAGLDSHPDVRAALESAPLVTGTLLPGTAFDVGQHLANPRLRPAQVEALEALDSDGLPAGRLILAGMTPGGPYPAYGDAGSVTAVETPETARMIVAVVAESAPEAGTIVEVADERFPESFSILSETPLTDIFASCDGTVAPDAPVAVLELAFGDAFPPIWRELVEWRDFMILG